MEKKEHIIVDATEQVAGKLAAKVAKLLLEGVRVTVVCAEEAVFVGSLEKAAKKFKEYLNKRCIVNPRRGAIHFREPRMHLKKIIKRMMRYKEYRGRDAMSRLTVYEGIPRELENQPRFKIACSLFKYTTKPGNKYVTIGSLLSNFGWKYAEITKKLTVELREREAARMTEEERSLGDVERLRLTQEFKDEVSRRLAAFS